MNQIFWGIYVANLSAWEEYSKCKIPEPAPKPVRQKFTEAELKLTIAKGKKQNDPKSYQNS